MNWDLYAEDLRNQSDLLLRNNRYLSSDISTSALGPSYRQGGGGSVTGSMRRSASAAYPVSAGNGKYGSNEDNFESHQDCGKHFMCIYYYFYRLTILFLRADNSLGANNIMDVSRSLNELRLVNGKFSRKISILENMIKDCGQTLDANGEAQMAIVSRVDQIEHEVHNNIQSSGNLSKERSELIIQSKQLLSRISSLESHVRDIDEQYTTKDAFTRLLDTTVEQLRSLRSQSDASRTKSQQALSLVEGFALALFELNGGHSSSALRLDFLSTIAGDGRQLDQIVGLLIESIKGAVSTECRYQVNTAAEELTSVIRPITEGLRHQMQASAKEFQTVLLNVKSCVSQADDCKNHVTKLQTAVNTHEALLGGLKKQNLDFNAETVKAMVATCIDSVTQQLLLQKRQQESLEDENRELRKKISLLKENHEETFRKLESRVLGYENSQREQQSRLSNIEEKVETKQSILSTAESVLNVQEASIESLKDVVGQLKLEAVTVASNLNSLRLEMDLASSNNRSSEDIKGEFTSVVETLQGRLESVEMRTMNSQESVTEELQALRAIMTTTSKSATAMQANSQAMIATVIANLKDTIMVSVTHACAESHEDVEQKMVSLLAEVVATTEDCKKVVLSAGIVPRLVSLEHKQDDMDARMTKSFTGGSGMRVAEAEDIQKEVTMLHNAQAQLSDAQDEFTNSVEKIQSQLSALARSVAEKDSIIDRLQNDVNNFNKDSSNDAKSSLSSTVLKAQVDYLEEQVRRVESNTKLAMDALQEELVSLTVKMESVGACDDEGCGLAINCESKINNLATTVNSLQTFVNSAWKSSVAARQGLDSVTSIPPPPPVHPSVLTKAADVTNTRYGGDLIQRTERAHSLSRSSSLGENPSDVLAAMMQPVKAIAVPSAAAAPIRENFLNQLKGPHIPETDNLLMEANEQDSETSSGEEDIETDEDEDEDEDAVDEDAVDEDAVDEDGAEKHYVKDASEEGNDRRTEHNFAKSHFSEDTGTSATRYSYQLILPVRHQNCRRKTVRW
jgi:hypothetical protein